MSLFAYDVATNLQLKGNVKSVTKTNYNIALKFGDYFRTPNSKFVFTYDSNGKQIESTELTPRDVVVNKVNSTYDASGNLVEQVGFDGENVQLFKSVVTYKNGVKADTSEYGKEGLLKSKTIYTYDGTKLTDETYYNAEGAIVWKIIYSYNAKNQLEKETEYFADGSFRQWKNRYNFLC